MEKELVEMPKGLLSQLQQIISAMPAGAFSGPVAAVAMLHNGLMQCRPVETDGDEAGEAPVLKKA